MMVYELPYGMLSERIQEALTATHMAFAGEKDYAEVQVTFRLGNSFSAPTVHVAVPDTEQGPEAGN